MAYSLSHGHILATFFTATSEELAIGSDWYAAAYKACRGIADSYGLRPQVAVGVVAALSPNNRWQKNLLDAEHLCRIFTAGTLADCQALRVSTFGVNKAKAIRILAGEAPLDVLGGLKVRSFYECMVGGHDNSVCIDGHAYSVWLGQYIPTTKTPKISEKLYSAIAADYVAAAAVIRQITGQWYTAAQVQAVTWTVWQRIRREVAA